MAVELSKARIVESIAEGLRSYILELTADVEAKATQELRAAKLENEEKCEKLWKEIEQLQAKVRIFTDDPTVPLELRQRYNGIRNNEGQMQEWDGSKWLPKSMTECSERPLGSSFG